MQRARSLLHRKREGRINWALYQRGSTCARGASVLAFRTNPMAVRPPPTKCGSIDAISGYDLVEHPRPKARLLGCCAAVLYLHTRYSTASSAPGHRR